MMRYIGKEQLRLRIAGFFLFALFGYASALSVSAQDAKLNVVPEGFQFTGNWGCEGAFGSGKAHKSTFTGAVILGGKWIELAEQDIEPATGYLAKYLIGYDPQQKRYVEFDASNFGAATYTSEDGWKNRVLTMASGISQDPKAPYAANRFLYTVAAPDTFTVDWQISKTAALSWVQADHLVCRRTGTSQASGG